MQKLCQIARSIYLVRVPPLLDREEEEPADERMLLPEEYPPDERIELEDEERTVDEGERVTLLDVCTFDDERTGVVLADRVTVVELLRTGVAVVRVVVETELLGVVVLRVAVETERLGVVVLRVAVETERLGVVVLRVAEVRPVVVEVPLIRERVADDVLSVLLPNVRSPVVLTRVAVPRVVVPSVRAALRDSVRRAVSNARALVTLREALRTANERSG